MKNTRENKSQFFAQYLMERVLISRLGEKGVLTVLTTMGLHWSSHGQLHDKLELKALHDIEDEDLTRISEIIFPYLKCPNLIISRGYNKNGHRIDDSAICIEITDFIDIIQQDIIYALIQVDTKENDIITSYFEDNGRKIRDDSADNIIHVIDFLRSRGYALPWMGLSVEKQVEYGWVKIKQENIR